jgi:hypothetical protein
MFKPTTKAGIFPHLQEINSAAIDVLRRGINRTVTNPVSRIVLDHTIVPVVRYLDKHRPAVSFEPPPLFPKKISPQSIDDAVKSAGQQFPDRMIVILTDATASGAAQSINCTSAEPSDLDAFDYHKTIFIYACEQDDIGQGFVKKIIDRRGIFIPVLVAQPSTYANLNPFARDVLEAEYRFQQREQFDKWNCGPSDFVNLIQAIDITSHVKGSFVEVGCYQGSSGGVALRYFKVRKIPRRCYFLDVFEGFNYPAAVESSDIVWKGSHQTSGLKAISRRLRAYEDAGVGLFVDVLKSNIVVDDLPATIGPVALANIDVDLFEAVYAALMKLAPLIASGGIIIVEDPGHTPWLIGARVALNDFMHTEWKDKFLSIYMESGQTFLFRK